MPCITRRLASVILLVLSVSVATYVWWTRYEEIFNPTGLPAVPEVPNYSQVEDGLYMGGSVKEPPPGTRAVLNLCEIEDPYHFEGDPWPKIPDAAPAPSIDWLRTQVAFVDSKRRAGVPTYVHCAGGVSRAGMVTTAYLMFKNHWTRDDALAYLRTKRPIVNPNPAFMELLKQYEDEIAPTPETRTPEPDAKIPGKYELLETLNKQFALPDNPDLKRHLENRVIGTEQLNVKPREVK